MEKLGYLEPRFEYPDTVVLPFNPAPAGQSPEDRLFGGSYLTAETELRVRFGTDDDGNATDRVVEVALTHPDGLTATELRDFPWARWLRAVTAEARMAFAFSLDARDEAWDARAQANAVTKLPEPGSRPGKRGHGPEHWQWVAARYRELTTGGSHRPVAAIAEERGVSANTAAGWVSRCRKLGLLPPARHGKSG